MLVDFLPSQVVVAVQTMLAGATFILRSSLTFYIQITTFTLPSVISPSLLAEMNALLTVYTQQTRLTMMDTIPLQMAAWYRNECCPNTLATE